MDAHTLECLDFPRVRELLGGFAMTALGRRLAGAIAPATRPALVRRWLAQVAELRDFAHEHGLPPLGGVSDVREIVARCAPPLRVGADDLSEVARTLAATAAVTRYLVALPEKAVELRHLAGRIGDFSSIALRIREVIDERGQVRDDASPRIRRIRGEIAAARERIRQVVDRLLHDPAVRRLLNFANHTYIGDRLVLPLRTECRGRLPGIVHGGSGSGATLFVEPAQAVELNNHISNLRSEETEEINRLLWDLAHEVHINAEAIRKTLDALGVLDLIVAKLRLAKAFDMRVPTIIDEPNLNVRGARHPLLLELARQARAASESRTSEGRSGAGWESRTGGVGESRASGVGESRASSAGESRASDAASAVPGAPRPPRAGRPDGDVVPIDYRLGDDFDLLIITGPNTGGKTVTLKTVGLLSLMVQAGIPVPVAEGSRFGVFSRVLIDIGDEQSMQQSLSTFSAHMKRQLEMLQKAGPSTLVLIDELGAGTDPDQGAAIGRAMLDELLRSKCRGLVTTHIGALKGFPLQRQRAENACVDFDPVTLTPTYHLRIGEPGASNAIEIAQRLGMPRRLVNAARRNLARRDSALNAAIADTREARRRAESVRAFAEQAQVEADRAQREAQIARQILAQRQADFERWMQRVAHLRPGDAVRVRDFEREGKVLRVRLENQRAEIDMGAFAIEAPFGDILPPEAPAPPPPPPRPPRPELAAREREREQRRAARRAARPGARAGQPPADSGARPSAPGAPSAARGGRREPALAPLTPEQAQQLSAGDEVFVRRFHRDGRIVRVDVGKQVATVTVGVLELEVPLGGLAVRLPDARAPRGPRPKRQRKSQGAGPSQARSPAPPPKSQAAEPGAPASPPSEAQASQRGPGAGAERSASTEAQTPPNSKLDADGLASRGAPTVQ